MPKTSASFLILICFICICCKQEISFDNYQEEHYGKLENELNRTKLNLNNYLQGINQQAKGITTNKVMTSFFLAKREYYALSRDTVLPTNIVASVENLKQKIRHHYLLNYLNFYDILFVGSNGDIFYTIRKEKDYHKNIFEGKLAETELSDKLKNNPGQAYVDFQFYEYSGKSSAFFIEPFYSAKGVEGWFVLQCDLNKINHLFEENAQLGSTGEVILVNKQHYLLTNSRFKASETVFKQKLPDHNIEAKFQEVKGKKCVIDYRNKEVLSVFEVVKFLNTEWLVIVKSDMDELETKYYLSNENKLYPQMLARINDENITLTKPMAIPNNRIVEIDEFRRSDTNNILFTQGVSTCTGVAVCYPGRFAYMAHISPYDKIYNETKTDLLSRMLNQISYFDITGKEKANLEFYIVSGQDQSFKKAINLILRRGYFLSQIKIYYKPLYQYANITVNPKTNDIKVQWRIANKKSGFATMGASNKLSFNNLLVK